jgi:hypothetical protein
MSSLTLARRESFAIGKFSAIVFNIVRELAISGSQIKPAPRAAQKSSYSMTSAHQLSTTCLSPSAFNTVLALQ